MVLTQDVIAQYDSELASVLDFKFKKQPVAEEPNPRTIPLDHMEDVARGIAKICLPVFGIADNINCSAKEDSPIGAGNESICSLSKGLAGFKVMNNSKVESRTSVDDIGCLLNQLRNFDFRKDQNKTITKSMNAIKVSSAERNQPLDLNKAQFDDVSIDMSFCDPPTPANLNMMDPEPFSFHEFSPASGTLQATLKQEDATPHFTEAVGRFSQRVAQVKQPEILVRIQTAKYAFEETILEEPELVAQLSKDSPLPVIPLLRSNTPSDLSVPSVPTLPLKSLDLKVKQYDQTSETHSARRSSTNQGRSSSRGLSERATQFKAFAISLKEKLHAATEANSVVKLTPPSCLTIGSHPTASSFKFVFPLPGSNSGVEGKNKAAYGGSAMDNLSTSRVFDVVSQNPLSSRPPKPNSPTGLPDRCEVFLKAVRHASSDSLLLAQNNLKFSQPSTRKSNPPLTERIAQRLTPASNERRFTCRGSSTSNLLSTIKTAIPTARESSVKAKAMPEERDRSRSRIRDLLKRVQDTPTQSKRSLSRNASAKKKRETSKDGHWATAQANGNLNYKGPAAKIPSDSQHATRYIVPSSLRRLAGRPNK